MMYTVIYIDENDERKWKKASDIEIAEDYGKRMSSNNDYDLCVSLYEYDKLKRENKMLKGILGQIEAMCKTNKEVK